MNAHKVNINDIEPRHKTAKIPVHLLAINHRGYYSLPIRILALISRQSESVQQKYHVTYSEWTIGDDINEIFNSIISLKPGIIGISINIWNRDISFDLIRLIKQQNPDITIVAGGQEMTHSVVDYLNFLPELDYIIDGEGELPFIQLLNSWDPEDHTLKIPDNVSGLHYRQGKTTVFTRPADTVDSLDEIPSVILNGMIDPKKIGPIGVLLEGTRGCPFQCSFCFEASRRNRPIMAPIKKLRDEMAYMVSSGVSLFHIMDPILCNGSPERLKKLSNEINRISQKYNTKLEISVEVYGDRISDEIAEWMGIFSAIDVGLQSTHPDTLKAINRPYSREKFCEGIRKLKKTGAIINIYLIIGLPYETFQTCLSGIKFVMDQHPTKMFLNELVLLNGTELRVRADEFGYDFDLTPPYIIKRNSWMTAVEISVLNNLAIDVVRRYNLSFEALPQKNPLFAIKRHDVCMTLRVCLKKDCSKPCMYDGNCSHADSADDEVIEGLYRQANNKNIEFNVDGDYPLPRLLHHAVQFQLSGANRMKIQAPVDYFSDIASISKMVNSGIWHFKPVVCMDEFENDLNEKAIQTILHNLRHTFPILGRGHIQPYLEIILLTACCAIKKVRAKIDMIRHNADSIGLPDISSDFCSEDRSHLIDLFVDSLNIHQKRRTATDPGMMAPRPNYWMKLPMETTGWVVNALRGSSELSADTVRLFYDLGLSYSNA